LEKCLSLEINEEPDWIAELFLELELLELKHKKLMIFKPDDWVQQHKP
jgi:hypothetical protein